jgi:plastocyanin
MRSLLPLLLAAVVLLVAPAGASAATSGTLVGTVNSNMTITLKTRAGARVTSVRAGSTWNVVVHDNANAHNFRLSGPGFSRQTRLSFVGTQTWTVTFRAGTWTYLCTEHPDTMRGTLRAR